MGLLQKAQDVVLFKFGWLDDGDDDETATEDELAEAYQSRADELDEDTNDTESDELEDDELAQLDAEVDQLLEEIETPEPIQQMSSLDDINGVGPTTANKLTINDFHTPSDVYHASGEELMDVDGIGPHTVETIASFFAELENE